MVNHTQGEIAELIDAAGGSASLAAALGVSPSAVRLWKMRCRLPQKRVEPIMAQADRLGVVVSPTAFGLDRFGDFG